MPTHQATAKRLHRPRRKLSIGNRSDKAKQGGSRGQVSAVEKTLQGCENLANAAIDQKSVDLAEKIDDKNSDDEEADAEPEAADPRAMPDDDDDENRDITIMPFRDELDIATSTEKSSQIYRKNKLNDNLKSDDYSRESQITSAFNIGKNEKTDKAAVPSPSGSLLC